MTSPTVVLMRLPEESDKFTLRLVESWAARPSAESSRIAPVPQRFRFLFIDRSLFSIQDRRRPWSARSSPLVEPSATQ
jgi:hypothetical protein